MVAASVATVVAVLFVLVGVAVTATTLYLVVKKRVRNRKDTLRKVERDENTSPESM